MEKENEQFNSSFIQLVLGLQSTAWMALGKTANPRTGKSEVNLDLARDSIDTLLMLKEKTKGNLTETEKGFMENSMQDLEMNYITVSKIEDAKKSEKADDQKATEPAKEKEEEQEEKEPSKP